MPNSFIPPQACWPPTAVPEVDVPYCLKQSGPLVDARSPSEFKQGHMPGAVNVPLFDDDERAEVGTLYKQVDQSTAVSTGLGIVSAKAHQLLDRLRQLAPSGELTIHCWRGGMRSLGLASFCQANGLKPQVLTGGYKAFRRAAHSCFAEARSLVVLTGSTGTGKTELLNALGSHGQQTIDLEALAHHRGSVFGGIGQPAQPTVEQFENDLFMQLRQFDPRRPIWVEDESRAIGQVFLPQIFWEQMSAAVAIVIELPLVDRAKRLTREYGRLPKAELLQAVQRLKKRLGGGRLAQTLEMIHLDRLEDATEMLLIYYDKSYRKALQSRTGCRYATLQRPAHLTCGTVEQLIALSRRLLADNQS